MKTKRIALLLAILFSLGLLLAACGGDEPSASPDASTPSDDPGGSSGGLDWEPPANITVTIPEAPAGAIDFSDGLMEFAAVNLTPGDADPSELSLISHNGGSALKATLTEGKTPYVGIDVSSLYGDRLPDIRSISILLWLDMPGSFYAASGVLDVFTGAGNDVSEVLWAVTLEKNNPTLIHADLDELGVTFAVGAKNIIVLRKGTGGDAADRAGAQPSNFIIDFVAAYDAAGNVIPADTSASFDAPRGFGAADTSLLFEVEDEVRFAYFDNGATGESSGWGQAGMIDRDNFDLDVFVPGSVITVAYGGPRAPEIIFQTWSGGPQSWAKVEPFMVNLSGNLAQFRYEDVVESFGTDDFDTYLDRINIGDRGNEGEAPLEVKSFSIGMRTHEIEYRPVLMGDDEFIDLTPFNIHSGDGYSAGNWVQLFRMDTAHSDENPPDFKPGWIVPGAYITAYYESEKFTQFIFQRFGGETFDWGGQIWANLTGDSQPGGYVTPELTVDNLRVPRVAVEQISYEGIMARWARDGDPDKFYDELCAFWIQDDGTEYTLFKLVLYTPNPSGELDD
ncbi:MAG: hypothetical protein FWG72_03265 [Oscillospiraceae bacterium]|nr:hypothetical protein [Oscillospiraceae bacterium]